MSPRRERTYKAWTRKDLDRIPAIAALPEARRVAMKAVSAVLPFRVNAYVVEELIDWDAAPDDPMFQLAFPQPGMLEPEDLARMEALVRADAPREAIEAAAREIQLGMHPHPAGQLQLNVPRVGDRELEGLQHKYRETVLFFPSQGQTCHAYCTYCFRWAQFVGIEELRFASREVQVLRDYVAAHREVHSVLITGGDPLIMKASVLRRIVEPLLDPALEHVQSVRLGTKSLAWWPHRFLDDPDADEVLRLFEEVVASGRHLALMAHYTHPRELDTPAAQAALRRVLRTGAVVRCQAPLVRHVNDDADTWAELWRAEVRLGAVPYYLFVERDTGPKRYFEVPLARAHEIFHTAYRRVSGLARTVRGPSMSATPGKIEVVAVEQVAGERVFVLRFLQGRDPEWVGRAFFARFDPEATWLDDLVPAFGERRFFWEDGMDAIRAARGRPGWRRVPTRARPALHDLSAWD